jgi:hypothetical protein
MDIMVEAAPAKYLAYGKVLLRADGRQFRLKRVLLVRPVTLQSFNNRTPPRWQGAVFCCDMR